MRWFEICYVCDDCGTEWTDEWSCACDDECPNCGATVEAWDWEIIRTPSSRELKHLV